jgi:hypothetical protein
MLESSRLCQPRDLQVRRQQLELSSILSFPELPPIEFGLQPLLIVTTPSERVRTFLLGLILSDGLDPSPGVIRGTAEGA